MTRIILRRGALALLVGLALTVGLLGCVARQSPRAMPAAAGSGSLTTSGAATIGGGLTVGGNATISGSQAITGNLVVRGALLAASQGITGNQTIGGSQGVTGSQTVTGASTLAGGVHIGGASDYIQIGPTGIMTLTGNATVWDDVRVALGTAKTGATAPGFDVWKDGIRIYAFDKSTPESVHFELQMPHTFKVGSAVYPHLHWMPKTTGALNATVSWGLECAYAPIGSVFVTSTVKYSNTHYPADATLVADKHYLTIWSPITLTGSGISSMQSCRMFRDADGVGLTDNYDDDAFALEFDEHIENDSLGSNEELSK